ncbi:unnamed protein product [Adineta ricciae]|uniref:CxC5 like cysteine cluster associated with KDZ domain-containing protein n=1 Tax=Adineta ricciae TaxID=249248 RepID=A0A814JKT8_ADIRI|nr:unnamed protein product [Adineta ricciae]
MTCFSLKCDSQINLNDTNFLPLFRRMSNLEKLTLYLRIKDQDRFADGTLLQNEILVHMPHLHSFIFYICTYINTDGLQNQLSSEDIQRTFTNIGQHVVSMINHSSCETITCSVFSIPFTFDRLHDIGHMIPNTRFNYVTYLVVRDVIPFNRKFFIQVARAFPLLMTCRIFNRESQSCQFTDSQSYEIAEYPYLTYLDILCGNIDYLEQFLNETKTYVPCLTKLRVVYNNLRIVTNKKVFRKYRSMGDIDYLQLVLSDFTLKQLFYINWFNNNLDIGVANRNMKIIELLRECTGDKLEKWTSITIEQSLMAINGLDFLSRTEEILLDAKLRTYLTSKDCSDTIIEPYVQKCCDTSLTIAFGRKITIFKMDRTYTGTIAHGNCSKCMKQYSHNYFMDQGKKYVTYNSIFNSDLIYLGGNYGYDKQFIVWLSNSILYLYSGFENFAKCYNATNNVFWNTNGIICINLCPARIQDFWFLYNFINISFFYNQPTILEIPSNCDRQNLVEFMNANYDILNKHYVNCWALHKERHTCERACSMAFVTDGFQKSSRFICSNIKMVVRSEELGKLKNISFA